MSRSERIALLGLAGAGFVMGVWVGATAFASGKAEGALLRLPLLVMLLSSWLARAGIVALLNIADEGKETRDAS